jgi:hypothetical protein
MFSDEVGLKSELPSPEERRRILEQAGMVLAKARALMDRLDQSENQSIWPMPLDRPTGPVALPLDLYKFHRHADSARAA